MMAAIDDLVSGFRTNDKVRFRIIRENPGFGKIADRRSAREIAGSVARFSSEVVVKVSGYTKSGLKASGKGAGSVSSHINYISRHGKITIETDRGELISGKNGVRDFCADWQQSIDSTRTSEKSRDVMHIVLSMPGNMDPEKMRLAIRKFASATFGHNHEYAFVLHSDTGNTHGHLAVKCQGFDGKKIHMGRGVAQEWRIAFAASLRAQGIDAEATPRSFRGVLRKAQPQAFRHMEQPAPESGRKPRIPDVRKHQIRETLDGLEKMAAGKPLPENEMTEKARSRINAIKDMWLRAAMELEAGVAHPRGKDGPSLALAARDIQLAGQIRNFVENMPQAKTQREVMREKMLKIGAGLAFEQTGSVTMRQKISESLRDIER